MMKTRIIQNIKTIMIGMGVLTAVLVPAYAAAPTVYASTPQQQVCEGLGLRGSGNDCQRPPGPSIISIMRTVINILSWIVGIAGIIMVIVAGMKYVTSGGDANGVKSAKDTLVYAIVGLIIAVLAQAIVQFVLDKAKNGA
jgi:hypothetical protein